MRKLLLGAAAAIMTLAAIPAAEAQFYIWGGRHFCWYDSAWNGPGWYWCGYGWRRGFGWGGGHRLSWLGPWVSWRRLPWWFPRWRWIPWRRRFPCRWSWRRWLPRRRSWRWR